MPKRARILAALLVATLTAPVSAQPPADPFLSRAIMNADGKKHVRVVTRDGRTLEGWLSVAGNTVQVSGDRESNIALDDVAELFVRVAPGREAMQIGGFLGGFAAGLIGFALDDVNTVYTTVAGTLLGYGIGYAFRGQGASWQRLYPAPPPVEFARSGWFMDGSAGMGRTDTEGLEEWFLAGGAGLGVTITPSLALTLASSSWIDPGIIDSFDEGQYDVFSSFGLRALYTPGVGLVAGVGVGAAVGERNAANDDLDATEWGWSVSGTLAWEFKLGKTTLMGPYAGIDYLAFDGDRFQDVTMIAAGLRLATY